ncbi:cardiolipin synthase [Paenibacillus thailandensis]|uniref:Cardiolipin synthase n=1 Tax=Paenibacillus thailandensis TaxID=393250 RepID=A0ABW5QRQ0_9BACL
MLWIVAVLLLFIIQLAAVIVLEYKRSNKAVSWLVVLFVLPILGFLPYYFLAREYACDRIFKGKDSRNLEQTRLELVDRCNRRISAEAQEEMEDERMPAILRTFSTAPAYCCETEVFDEGERAFEAMLESIAAARHHVHVEFYIIRDDELGRRFERLLIRKAREGIKVRLIYDGIGSRKLGKDYVKRLRAAGVETGTFFPFSSAFMRKCLNYRNHRKIVVVDGRIGFFGGLNIGDEYLGKDPYFGYWRDTHFCIRGDAVLWLQYTFLTDWLLVKGQLPADAEYFPDQPSAGNQCIQIVKTGPDETILELVFSLIVSAKKRIYIETPYFIPDPGVLLALKTAVKRGVDVKVIIPSIPDKELVYFASLSYVREMLEAGVRFFRYRKGFLHVKAIICDDLACSGTANMDMRSFSDQFEISAVFIDEKIVGRLVEQFKRDLGESEEIGPSEFEGRPKKQRMKEVFARLLSPLF